MSIQLAIKPAIFGPNVSIPGNTRTAPALPGARSEGTQRVYASQWAQWTAWARRRGCYPLPADPLAVAAYLSDRAGSGVAMGTLRLTRAAIAAFHGDAGVADPTDTDEVRRIMSCLPRDDSRPQRQAAGITRKGLAAIKATAVSPRTGPSGRRESEAQARVRGLVDVALVAVMRDGLLRHSEAAALIWADIHLEADGSGWLTVRRPRSGRGRQGAVMYLSRATMRSLDALRPDGHDPEATVFNLSPDQIGRRIRAAAEAAGLQGEFNGHSPKVGMAQDLAASGCELPALMNAGTSLEVARYYRVVLQFSVSGPPRGGPGVDQ